MEITIKWIGGASIILLTNDLKIAMDPVLCPKGTVQDYFWFKSERIEPPVFTDQDFEQIDLWLITHDHEDHLDQMGLSKMDDSSKCICNQNAYHKLRKNRKKDVTVLDWDQQQVIFLKDYKIEITAIPAIHGINPLSALLAGKVNGYYLTISKNDQKISIYCTGDTVYKNSIIRSLKNKEIDLMIPNMGAAKQGSWIMTLTLDAGMLAKMIRELQPKVVIPVHFGTFEHYKEPVSKIKALNDERIKLVEVGSKLTLNL